jgi:septal ring factor EnvC (AmiA/AmiB activator)
MKQRDQLTAEIANFKKLLKTQGKKFALARKNLAATKRAIARTRAKKGLLTPKESQGLNDALKTSHEEVSAIYIAIIAMEADLKSFEASLAHLSP